MKKIMNHPVALTVVLFLYMEFVGLLAGWISYQLLSRIPRISDWFAVNYINMFITELLSLGALLLFFRNVIASLKEEQKSGFSTQKQITGLPLPLFFLPVGVQIGWDISSLFLEEISSSAIHNGLVLFFLCLIATMSIALLEETAWRKIVFQSMRQKWGVVQGILVSSFLFGIVHYMNMLTGGQTLVATTIQVVQAIGMGMFLASLYYITDNFLLVVFIHGLCNFSNFFCNEMIEWNYAGYWWDPIWQAAFTILYFVVSVLVIKRQISRDAEVHSDI